MEPQHYFQRTDIVNKKRYDALREFFLEGRQAGEIAQQYGYTTSAFYSLIKEFKGILKESEDEDPFFKDVKFGRKAHPDQVLDEHITSLRKQNFSTEDIVSMVNSMNFKVSYGYVHNLLKREGFGKLPRRSKDDKDHLLPPKLTAPASELIALTDQRFQSNSTGVLALLPIILAYGIDVVIRDSEYPETKVINRESSILSFIALKLSSIQRYSEDDLWCMDRGLGLFAGLNVLPKTAWLSSYSSRVTTGMNHKFLKSMHELLLKHGLLSDTCNMDFTTVPYWGDDSHLENNWSGKRNKALASMLTVLAQNPDNGIIDYANSDKRHSNQSESVIEYLDFYNDPQLKGAAPLQYLVFDSKFSNYENLSALDDRNVKFITIRRRGKQILETIAAHKDFKEIRVEASGLKKRTLKILDQIITLKGYANSKTGALKQIRQITITGHGKIKPALIITNDNNLSVEQIIRKYSRRWLVEKGISEQIEFFHLNKVGSSMVIKVDFDLCMTVLAHNIYRIFATHLDRYSHLTAHRIYDKFIANSGYIEIKEDVINIELKKKRDLPMVLEMMANYKELQFPWLGNKTLNFIPSSSS